MKGGIETDIQYGKINTQIFETCKHLGPQNLLVTGLSNKLFQFR